MSHPRGGGWLHSRQSGSASAPRFDREVIPYQSKPDKSNPSGGTSSPIPCYIIFLSAVNGPRNRCIIIEFCRENRLRWEPTCWSAISQLQVHVGAAAARTTGCYAASNLTRSICAGASNVIFQCRSEQAILIHEKQAVRLPARSAVPMPALRSRSSFSSITEQTVLT